MPVVADGEIAASSIFEPTLFGLQQPVKGFTLPRTAELQQEQERLAQAAVAKAEQAKRSAM